MMGSIWALELKCLTSALSTVRSLRVQVNTVWKVGNRVDYASVTAARSGGGNFVAIAGDFGVALLRYTDAAALTTPMSSVPDTNAIVRIKNMAQLTEIRNRACMTSLGRVRRRWPDVHSTQVPLRAFVRAPRSLKDKFC